MSAPVLYDALGPRGRRRVQVGSVVVFGLLALLVLLAVRRFAAKGQLSAELWRPFTEREVIEFFARGLLTTVRVALVAMVLAVLLGGALALGRLSLLRPLRWLSGGYVEVFRALPLLLLIYFSARGLPRYGVDLSAFWLLVLALVAYNGAVLGEIFRAGILSLDRGQSEAAYSIGLSYWQAMLLVVAPQAVRRMVPALVSQLITLLKDTSLGFVIPLEELLRRGQINGEFTGNVLQSYLVVAVIYIMVNLALSRLARRLEIRQRSRYGAGPVNVGGIEDLAVLQAQGDVPAGAGQPTPVR